MSGSATSFHAIAVALPAVEQLRHLMQYADQNRQVENKVGAVLIQAVQVRFSWVSHRQGHTPAHGRDMHSPGS